MARKLQFRVPRGRAPERLDLVLAELAPEMSRRGARRLIGQGSVFVDGKRVQVHSRRIKTGALITVEAPGAPPPPDVPVHVLFRDGDAVVANKPSQVPTEPTRQAAAGTLAHALRHHLGLSGRDFLAAVHRLDVETSGAVLFACSPEAARALSTDFQSKAAERRYLALVEGEPTFTTDIITAPLGPMRSGPPQKGGGRREIVEGGQGEGTEAAGPQVKRIQSAETVATVLARGEGRSLLLVSPRTGRTHQIRAHLAWLGHPIVGDRRYGRGAGRCFGLHALGLRLSHGARVLSVLAPLPEAFIEATTSAAIPPAILDSVLEHYATWSQR